MDNKKIHVVVCGRQNEYGKHCVLYVVEKSLHSKFLKHLKDQYFGVKKIEEDVKILIEAIDFENHIPLICCEGYDEEMIDYMHVWGFIKEDNRICGSSYSRSLKYLEGD
jgi:hypothetical protein